MDDKRFRAIVHYVTHTPWAIWPAALVTMGEIIQMRIDGVELSADEVSQRIDAARRDRETAKPSGGVRLIPVQGAIIPHADMFTDISGGFTIDQFRADLAEAVADSSIGAIVLDIDSPGGSVELLQEAAQDIRAARERKHVVAVTNAFSASAAYYLQAQASEVVSTPSGQTGSIGTIAFHQSLARALEMEGIDTTVVTSDISPFKALQNPFEQLNDEGKAEIQETVNAYGAEFIRDVAIGRGLDESTVQKTFGQGRMLRAEQALQVGMIDRIASLNEVISGLVTAPASPGTRRTRAEATAEEPQEALGGSNVANGGHDDPPTHVLVGEDPHTGVLLYREGTPEELEVLGGRETVFDVAAVEASRIGTGTGGSGIVSATHSYPGRVTAQASAQTPVPGATSRGAASSERGDAMETSEAPRTREGIVARMAEIESRQREMDQEWGTRLMSADADAEWETLEQEYHTLEQILAQGDRRTREIERKAQNGSAISGDGQAEPSSLRVVSSAPASNVDTKRRLPENLFDLPSYRNMVTSVDDLADLWAEAALRVNDGLAFESEHPEVAQRHVEILVKKEQASSKPVIDTADSFAHRILVTSDPAYDRAFGKMIMNKPMTTIEKARIEAAVSHTGLGSETPVPVTIDPTVLLTSDGQVNPLRQLARVVSITGNKWRGISSAGASVVYEAELTQVADQTPAFDTPEFTVAKAHGYVEYSIEVDQDWPELRSNLGIMFQDAKDAKEAEKFLFGDGTDEPGGLLAADPVGLVGSTSEIDTATAVTLTLEDFYALKAALPPRWRARASWLANDTIWSHVRGFGETNNNTFWVDLNDDRPPRFLGKPVYEASEMSDDPDLGDSAAVVYGDFSRGFVIVDRVGLNVELIPHVLGANRRPIGARALYAYFRNTSGLMTKNAFRLLNILGT